MSPPTVARGGHPPPLVLLHGFASGPAAFARVLAHLPLSQRAVALPLPGHAGGREVPEGGFDACVHVLAVDIQRQLQEPIHLVGYSLGGRLAMGLLALMPSAIARLTLVSAHPGLVDPRERSARRATDRAWCATLEAGDLTLFASAWEAQPLFATRRALPEPARRAQRAALLANDPHRLSRAMAAMSLAEMADHRATLRDAHVPITLVAGALDPTFSAIALDLAAMAPHLKAHLIDGAGHDPLTEAPERLAVLLGHA